MMLMRSSAEGAILPVEVACDDGRAAARGGKQQQQQQQHDQLSLPSILASTSPLDDAVQGVKTGATSKKKSSIRSSLGSIALPSGIPGVRNISVSRSKTRNKYAEAEKNGDHFSDFNRKGSKGSGGGGPASSTQGSMDRAKVRLSLKYVGLGYQQYMQNKWLRSTERLPPEKLFGVLEELRESLIFKNATPEEKVLLAHRLRYIAVEDGAYLIREGEESEPALFIIAAGKATISVEKAQQDGTIQEVDVKDIKAPDYFGEGRCLTNSKAYANVRAKEGLVAYLLLKSDIDELLSARTRSMMVRDMHVRKFQKEHLDNLFEVMKDDKSGMKLLEKFARDQNMDANLRFYRHVMRYRDIDGDDVEKMTARAAAIYDEFLRNNGPDRPPPLIVAEPLQLRIIEKAIWKFSMDTARDDFKEGPGEGDLESKPKQRMYVSRASMDQELDLPDSAQHDQGDMKYAIPTVPLPKVFDDILNQSAIPTIRTVIMPKFIQSKFLESYMELRFPRLEHSMSESKLPLARLGTTFSGRRSSEFAFSFVPPGLKLRSKKSLERTNSFCDPERDKQCKGKSSSIGPRISIAQLAMERKRARAVSDSTFYESEEAKRGSDTSATAVAAALKIAQASASVFSEEDSVPPASIEPDSDSLPLGDGIWQPIPYNRSVSASKISKKGHRRRYASLGAAPVKRDARDNLSSVEARHQKRHSTGGACSVM